MNKKPTIVIIAFFISAMMFAGCVPEQYRVSIEPDENYPEEFFPFYKQSVVFEYSGGNQMDAKAGVKDSEADIIGFYKEILDGAYYTESSSSVLEGVYHDYLFKIQVMEPSEEESKAFSKVYTMQIQKLSEDLSGNYQVAAGYPSDMFKVYEDARIFFYSEVGTDFDLSAGTAAGTDDVEAFYSELLGKSVLDEKHADGGYVMTGYSGGYIFTIKISKAQEDRALAFTTIIDITLQSAKIDYTTAPSMEWSLCLAPDGNYDVRVMERSKNGYLLAGVLNSDAWVVKVSADGAVQWQSTFGGSEPDAVNAIVPTEDGGLLAVGITSSADGDVAGWHEGKISGKQTYDVWLVKLDEDGKIEWQKTYGGSANEYGMGAIKTEGGYMILATVSSEDGDAVDWHKGYYKSKPLDDVWVLKTDENGAIEWQKALGGTANDIPEQIISSGDGGCYVCSETWSDDGDVVRENKDDSSRDIWVVKLSETGETQWQNTLGGSSDDYYGSIQQAGDGGAYVAGSTRSDDGDVGNAKGSDDYWVVKLSKTGELVMQNALGGSGFDYLQGMHIDEGENIIVSGWAYSADGDKTLGYGDSDIWTAKLSSGGVLVWEKTLGGSRFDSALDIFQAGDEGYTVAGYTSSVDGDIAGRQENEYGTPTYDYWLANLDINGELVWESAYGGSANDHLDRVIQTPDGGYLLAGTSYSADNAGAEELETPYYWVLKLKHGYAVN